MKPKPAALCRIHKNLELYEGKLKSYAQNFLDQNVGTLKKTSPVKAFDILKLVVAKPWDSSDSGVFVLAEHVGWTVS